MITINTEKHGVMEKGGSGGCSYMMRIFTRRIPIQRSNSYTEPHTQNPIFNTGTKFYIFVFSYNLIV